MVDKKEKQEKTKGNCKMTFHAEALTECIFNITWSRDENYEKLIKS